MIVSIRFAPLIAACLILPCEAYGPGIGTSLPPSPDDHAIDDLLHPESVAQGSEGTFYTANIGKRLAPSEKDGDGGIARLTADGTVETLRYLPSESSDATLHAPKGTVVTDGRLYTADIDRIVGFDLDERTKIAEISLQDKDVSFLNDVAVRNPQTLLVSASNQGRIYRVDLEKGTATALDVSVPGVNGLVYAADTQTLYAVTFGGKKGGMLWNIALNEAGAVVEATSRTVVENGRFDGIVLRPNGHVLVSDWGVEGAEDPTPALHRVDLSDPGTKTTVPLTEWAGPADFTCDAALGCWIPDLPGSTVRVVHPDERME